MNDFWDYTWPEPNQKFYEPHHFTRAVKPYRTPTGKDFLPGTTKRHLASMRNREPE